MKYKLLVVGVGLLGAVLVTVPLAFAAPQDGAREAGTPPLRMKPLPVASLRVVLVESSVRALSAIGRQLEAGSRGELAVAGAAHSAAAALALCRTVQPMVIIVDGDLAEHELRQTLPQLRQALPRSVIIVLLGANTPDRTRSLLCDAGASHGVGQADMRAELLPAIYRLLH